MPASFATTTGRKLTAVTLNVTSLTANTVYVARFAQNATDPGTHNVEFTTDGSGNATVTYVPQNGRGAVSAFISPKVAVAAVTSSNTFTAV